MQRRLYTTALPACCRELGCIGNLPDPSLSSWFRVHWRERSVRRLHTYTYNWAAWHCSINTLVAGKAWTNRGRKNERKKARCTDTPLGTWGHKAINWWRRVMGRRVETRVQDWSLQCSSNAIWPFKLYLFQNNPSEHNPKLRMKTSFEVLDIIWPPQEPTSVGHCHYKKWS